MNDQIDQASFSDKNSMNHEKEVVRRALDTGITKNFRLPHIGGRGQIWYKLKAVKTDHRLKAIDESIDAAIRLRPYWTPTGGTPQPIASPAWLAIIYNLSANHDHIVAHLKEKHVALLALVVPPEINDKDAKKLLRVQTRGKTWINQTADFAPFDINDGQCIRWRWCDVCKDWLVRASGTCPSCERRENYHECALCSADAKKPYPLCFSCYQRSLARVQTPDGNFQHESNTAAFATEERTSNGIVSARNTRDIDALLAEMNRLLEEENG